MIHIIDGNNLAGKLKMLGRKNFDKILIARLKDYYGPKIVRVYLVFDGHDEMGDNQSQGLMSIRYSPRDRFCCGADDKIVELIGIMTKKDNDELLLITSDRELISRSLAAAQKNKRPLAIKSCEEFAGKLITERQNEFTDKEDLTRSQTERLNEELLILWTK